MDHLNILISIVVVQQILDMWTTHKALSTGNAVEKNKLLKGLMDKIGVIPAMLATKLPFVALVVILPMPNWHWYTVLGVLIVGYTLVLYNNFKVLYRLGAI